MHPKVVCPVVAAICLSSLVLEYKTAAAQKVNINSNPGVIDNNSSNQQIPPLSIDGTTAPAAEQFRNYNDLKSVSDSIKFNHHPDRKRSIDPLQYFQPPSFPSSIKVPVQHFR